MAARLGDDPREMRVGCRASAWQNDWLLRREDQCALGGLLLVGVAGRSGLLPSSLTLVSTWCFNTI